MVEANARETPVVARQLDEKVALLLARASTGRLSTSRAKAGKAPSVSVTQKVFRNCRLSAGRVIPSAHSRHLAAPGRPNRSSSSAPRRSAAWAYAWTSLRAMGGSASQPSAYWMASWRPFGHG